MNTPHVVIIGGGFGGLDAARALAGAPVRVTLIDRHNYHLFQPLLYQVATASLSPGDIASPIRWILRHQKNVQVLLAEARDRPGRAARRPRSRRDARMSRSRLPDRRDGAAHAYFGHPEWAARAPGLKTLDDALEMRRRVLLAFEAAEREPDPEAQKRLLTFVIVGGGPTGVELAGALAEIARQSLRQDFRNIRPESARIVLLEGSPHVLAAFPPRAAGGGARVAGAPRRRGANQLDRDGRRRGRRRVWRPAPPGRRRAAGRAERIEAQTVLWAAGVAASPLAKSLGVPLDRAGRVVAEPTLAVPGHPEIFVVGDVCAFSRTASRCRAWRRSPCRKARTPRATSCARSAASRWRRSGIATTATWRRSAADRRWPTSGRSRRRGSSRGSSGSSFTSSG